MNETRFPEMGAIKAIMMGPGLQQEDVDLRKFYYRALAWHTFNMQNGEQCKPGCMHCGFARQSEEVRAFLTTLRAPGTAVEEKRDEPSKGRRSIISFVDSFSY
jgi:uncharacterized glyoxalase superfamily metalloenzyme YdcJ